MTADRRAERDAPTDARAGAQGAHVERAAVSPLGYPLEKDDVTVEEIADTCDECGEAIAGPSYTVAVDFRSAGIQHCFGRSCKACAEELAERIRDGLPASASEPEPKARPA